MDLQQSFQGLVREGEQATSASLHSSMYRCTPVVGMNVWSCMINTMMDISRKEI